MYGRMFFIMELFIFIFIIINLLSCSILYPRKRGRILQYAYDHNSIPEVIYTPLFPLQIIKHLGHNSKVLRVYLEGDGHSWQNGEYTADPTPRHLMLLSLMMNDPNRDTVYLARPCQFIKNNNCHPQWWTDKRYSKTILNTLNIGLNLIKAEGPWKKIELIGYSGGATLALLLAAIRKDVKSVRTIAGNLAPNFADNFHHFIKSIYTISPLKYRRSLSKIPQLHLVGNQDKVIPVNISQYYKRKLGNSKCVHILLLPNVNHFNGWLKIWKQLLNNDVYCN